MLGRGRTKENGCVSHFAIGFISEAENANPLNLSTMQKPLLRHPFPPPSLLVWVSTALAPRQWLSDQNMEWIGLLSLPMLFHAWQYCTNRLWIDLFYMRFIVLFFPKREKCFEFQIFKCHCLPGSKCNDPSSPPETCCTCQYNLILHSPKGQRKSDWFNVST